jgi:8-oxo-dGTP pyrophosphatase MutT (NUDIX family)
MAGTQSELLLAFGFGVVFVAALLILAVLFPRPTPFQHTTFRIVLALAAAGVAAMIPGVIELETSKVALLTISAGGALAVFVVVYFADPPKLTSEDRVWAGRNQVAAVCYRVMAGSPEFLLVGTTGGRWTFPKGKVDEGEDPSFAAKREAFEEAGAEGEIERSRLTSYRHQKKEWKSRGVEIPIDAYLLSVTKTSPPPERGREQTWFGVDQTREALSEGRSFKYAEELRRVVAMATERIAAPL